MTSTDGKPAGRDVTGLLLYLGAAVVAAIGIAWLILAQQAPQAPRATAAPSASRASIRDVEPAGASAKDVEELLRTAAMAVSTGMLVAPERFSARALYMQVLEADPDNAVALEGIRSITDALVSRAATALEQGRVQDASDSVSEALRTTPDHAAAFALLEQLDDLESAASAASATEAPAGIVVARTGIEAVRASGPAPVDPLLELRASFDIAVGIGRLLQPDGQSAKHFLGRMIDVDPSNPALAGASQRLSEALLTRAERAIEAADTDAATTWLEEAQALGSEPDRVEQVRASLTRALVAIESQTPVPAAELTILDYTSPRYPRTAATREIEGWVDLEFVVSTDGVPTEITVTSASHEDLFREEAVAAAEAWRFEPKMFLDQPIAQRVYTRIRFALE